MTILSKLASLMKLMKLKLQLSLMMMNKKIRRKYNKLQNLLKNLPKNKLKQFQKNQLSKQMIILLKLNLKLASSMHQLKLKQLLQKTKMIMIQFKLHLLMKLMTQLKKPCQFLLAANFYKLVLLMIMKRSQLKVSNQCQLLKSFYNQVSLKLMKSTKKKNSQSKLRLLKYKPLSLMIMKRSQLKVKCQLQRNSYNWVTFNSNEK